MENLLILIHERDEFENYIYDSLIEPYELFIDPTFWDPVIICLTTEQINNLHTVICDSECIICTNQISVFKNLRCCNNNICITCIDNWFNVSVFCPFCKKDQRELS